MPISPVPGDMFFSDFADEVVVYEVERFGKTMGEVKTLPDSENGVDYLQVLPSADVQIGDILLGPNGRVRVGSIETYTYDGKATLIRLYV